MFKILRWTMWLDAKATGKREIAFLMLVLAFLLTVWFGPSLDSKDLGNLLEWWIIAGFGAVAGAFGLHQIVDLYKGRFMAEQNPYQQMGSPYGYQATSYQTGFEQPFDPTPAQGPPRE